MINNLVEKSLFDYILIEADGSRGRPLKGYRENEPVVPQKTIHLMMVVGIDCIGKQLNETWVHRPEVVAELVKKPINSKISVYDVAQVLTHSKGFLKTLPENAGSYVLINKVDNRTLKPAHKLAQNVLEQKRKIGKIIIGHVKEADPVIDVY